MVTTLAQSLRNDRVGQLQLGELCLVDPDMLVQDVAAQMARQGVGYALVMRSEQLLGIFTERDFVNRVVAVRGDVRRPIREVMTAAPVSIPSDASLYEAIELMESRGFRHIPVIERSRQENGPLAGVLSVKDIVHYLVGYFPANVYNLPPTPAENQAEREGA